MILETKRYLSDWTRALNTQIVDAEDRRPGELNSLGQFWLERYFHPSLGCTEDDIARLAGSTFDPSAPPRSVITTMDTPHESMQVIGVEPGLGYLVSYERLMWTEDFEGELTPFESETLTVFVDPDLHKAFGPSRSCTEQPIG